MESPSQPQALAQAITSQMGIIKLPDEILLHILRWLDVPELLAVSRVSLHLRGIALDPLLHSQRLRASSYTLAGFLPHRPRLHTLQPPISSIYLTRTHVAARKLGFSLALVALNRSLSRRPPLSSLVNANIVPKDCCRRDRQSGEMHIATGGLVERKRKVEREKVKEGLRVWLERKAGVIGRRKDAAVAVLVWRFTKRAKTTHDTGMPPRLALRSWERPEAGKVEGLRSFWEDLGDGMSSHAAR